MSKPLTNNERYQVMPDASISRNKKGALFCFRDVQDAVGLLKEKIGAGDLYTKLRVLKLIDSCFPVFKEKKL